ncbi:MAG: hypothetical protein WC254_03810 [Candidatus Woesearchaeota archaeon]|jgi:hypothetical protein
MKLDKLIHSTFAQMTALGIALTTTMPVFAEEYPVYQSTPSSATFGKQWVGNTPQRTEEAITDPTLKHRINYEISAQYEKGIIQIHVEKVGTREYFQNFLIIETQEQTMYRPKCKALVKPGMGLVYASAGTAILGLLIGAGGLAAEDNETATVGGIMLGGGFAVELGAGFGIVKPCIKFTETDHTRTQELIRTTETRLNSSTEYERAPASNISLYISAPESEFNNADSTTVTTDNTGNATVPLTPANSRFAFTLEGFGNIEDIQQLQQAGYSLDTILPLVQEAAIPVQYTITVETRATSGINTTVTVPISGFILPPPAIENIVMKLP